MYHANVDAINLKRVFHVLLPYMYLLIVKQTMSKFELVNPVMFNMSNSSFVDPVGKLLFPEKKSILVISTATSKPFCSFS